MNKAPILFVFFIISSNVFAATKTWEGDVDSDWNNPNNWDGNTLPADDDEIVIDPTVFNYTFAPVMSVDSDFDPEDVNVENGGEFTITGGTLDINNDLEIKTSSTFTISGGTMNVGDDIDLEEGVTYNQSGGTVDISDELIVGIDGDSSAGGITINITGGQFDVGNDIEIYSDNNDFNFGGNADINVTDDIDFHGAEGNTFDITGNADLDVDELVEFGSTTMNIFNVGDNSSVTFTDGSDLADDNNALPFFNVTGNGSLDLGSITVLPVELLYFEAKVVENGVALTWATATEIDNDYFEVQRSADGKEFETVDIVDGNGDSDELIEYEFFDNSPLSGLSYYRLNQVDYDGQNEVFAPESVIISNHDLSSIQISVWPNPSTDRRFVINAPSAEFTIKNQLQVYDVMGTLIWEQSNIFNDNIAVDLNPLNIRSGVYFVTYTDQFGTAKSRFRIL